MADPSQPTERHAWHGPRGRSAERANVKQARQQKIYIIGGVMLVLAGAITALLFYLRTPPHPSLVVLRIDQYRDSRIPVSPWLTEDRDGLRGLGLPEKSTFTSQEKKLLQQQLGNLGHDQPKDQPLVVYLCAYAAVQENGDVALLPADAKVDDPASWLPFKEVLAAIEQCPVKNRLLLLDLGQPCIEPKAGLLAANVPERLKPVLETAVKDDANLQILTACGPGQLSLASEELGHTYFAHYLIQGLAGRADGFPDQPRDQQVKVQELIKYVTMQVDRWVFHNTGQRQTPEFFGNSAMDYPLVSCEGKTAPPPVPLPAEYPTFFLKGWTERDQWRDDRGVRTPPEQIVRLEETLLRADERWRQGEDAAKIESDLKAALERLQRSRAATVGPPDRSEPKSLAEAVERGQKPPVGPYDDALRNLIRLAESWAKVKAPKAGEKPSEMDVAALPKAMETFLKPYEGKTFELCWTVFAVALRDADLRSEHLRCWCDLLRPEGKPLPPYAEIDYLQRLANLPVAKADEWPAAAGEAIQLAETAEQVEALKPTTQPWLLAEYTEARQRREQAEKLLFSPVPAERQKATAPIRAALGAYADLLQHLKKLREAQRTRDYALVFLPGYTAYLERDSTRLATWLQAMQVARELHDLLNKSPEATQVIAALQQAGEKTSALQNSLRVLREPFTSALARGAIPESRPAAAADAMEMKALLRQPSLNAPDREALGKQARAMAGKLNAEALQRETTTDTLPPPDSGRLVRQERERAQLRAQVAQELLDLGGSSPEAKADIEKVKAARQRVADEPLKEAAWEELRRELRQAWKRHDKGG